MSATMQALVEAALADEHELEDAYRQLDAAIDAAPHDPALRRLRAQLHEATWRRTDQVADLRVLCELEPADRDAALALCRLEHRWAWQLATPPAEDDEDEPEADEAVVQALEQAAGARLLALAEAQRGDADWTAQLLAAWTDLPLATNVTVRLRLALQARVAHPHHAGLLREAAHAWVDLATTVPTAEPPPDKPPMGVCVSPQGDFTDALAAEHALAAIAAAPPDAGLAEAQAMLEQNLCRFDAAAAAWERHAALLRAAADAGDEEAAEAAEAATAQAARCRGGRAALAAGLMEGVDSALEALGAAPDDPPDLPEAARELMAQLRAGREERLASLREQAEAMQTAMTAGAAPPDFAALDEQADGIAGQILGAVPLQPMAWVPHDGRGLDPRLQAGAERWRALGLALVGWAEVPAYSRQFGAPTVAGLWSTPEGDALVVHIAVRHLENVDIETELADGRQLLTTLGRGRNFLGGGPWVDTLHLDHDADLAEVLALHRARVALAAGGTALRPVRSVADAEAMQERQRQAKWAWRKSEGLGLFEALGVPVEPAEHFAPRLVAAVRRRAAALEPFSPA